jgi:hypothetical protein
MVASCPRNLLGVYHVFYDEPPFMPQSACSSHRLIVICVPVHQMHSHVTALDTVDIESTMRLMIELVKALDRKKVNDLTVI